MIGLPGPPSGEQYRKQELHTQLGLDEQQRALRELERGRNGRLQSHTFLEGAVLTACAIAIVFVIFLALELLT